MVKIEYYKCHDERQALNGKGMVGVCKEQAISQCLVTGVSTNAFYEVMRNGKVDKPVFHFRRTLSDVRHGFMQEREVARVIVNQTWYKVVWSTDYQKPVFFSDACDEARCLALLNILEAGHRSPSVVLGDNVSGGAEKMLILRNLTLTDGYLPMLTATATRYPFNGVHPLTTESKKLLVDGADVLKVNAQKTWGTVYIHPTYHLFPTDANVIKGTGEYTNFK
jgi:hypothetical protein